MMLTLYFIGFYDAGVAICGSCHINCHSCSGSSSTSCTSCDEKKFRQINNGSCECQTGMIEKKNFPIENLEIV